MSSGWRLDVKGDGSGLGDGIAVLPHTLHVELDGLADELFGQAAPCCAPDRQHQAYLYSGGVTVMACNSMILLAGAGPRREFHQQFTPS